MIWVWPFVLVVIGALLLLHNFYLLEFNVLDLWPALLILLGLQVFMRGDIGLSWAAQPFGITRGSVEAGTLRVSSGELDVQLAALQQPGRLIAGLYTARSRPQLDTAGNRAILTMQRGNTWQFSLASWEIQLARDLPWDLVISSFLGHIHADLRNLILNEVQISTGITNIHVTAPNIISGPITLRSTFGNVYLSVPDDIEAVLVVRGSRLFQVRTQNDRWRSDAPGQFQTNHADDAPETLEITVSGTFGDLILA